MIITGFRLFLTYVKENKKTGNIILVGQAVLLKKLAAKKLIKLEKKEMEAIKKIVKDLVFQQ